MTDQTALQVLSIGIPTVTVLIGILLNSSRLNDFKQDMNRRFEETNRRVDDMRDVLRADMLRMESVMDARRKHLEDRNRY